MLSFLLAVGHSREGWERQEGLGAVGQGWAGGWWSLQDAQSALLPPQFGEPPLGAPRTGYASHYPCTIVPSIRCSCSLPTRKSFREGPALHLF